MADERITEGMKHQLGDLRRKLDRDERPLGYKLGFGTEPAMKSLGTDAPLVGHLVTANRLESGAVVDVSNWGNPKLEPEIVARAGDNGDITAIGAAIELVDLDTSIRDPQAVLEAGHLPTPRAARAGLRGCRPRRRRSSPWWSTARRWPPPTTSPKRPATSKGW